ncbi:MAG: SusC/RagA family TonB-linked outer membrane protein [Gemmatimonadales bacterium]|nr:SusC/RagA family TonB-linked outer membrane protein [Gemmatimonadales bacterium]
MRVPVPQLVRGGFLLLVGLLTTGTAAAQQGSVSGKVTDEGNGQPLAGARVQATTQQVFALTNQQGQYVLRGLTPGAHTLRIFMLGFGSQTKTVTITAGGTETVDWSLKAVPFQLEEIVTTATGEQATRELGNTVGKIQATQLVETAPTTNLSQVLSGRVAGVSVLQSNGTSGTGARIRIRGLSSVSLSNDPLLYIDGIRVAADAPAGAFVGGGSVSKLNDLNPEEIESIEIVKGPSAATLYGTQAANGVIRVTTKRGRAGAPQWNAWLEGGILKDTYTYPATYFNKRVGANADCLTWQEKTGVCQVEQRYTLDLLNDPASTPFTTGTRSQLGASVAGGSEIIRYFVSAEAEVEDGVLKLPGTEADYLVTKRGLASASDLPRAHTRPNHFNKYNFRVNLNSSPRSNLDIAVSSGFVVNNIRLPQTGDNFQSMIGTAMFGSANPAVFPVTAGYGFSRPGNSVGEETYRKNDHFINSGTINWRPLSWLSTRGTFGIDYLLYADEQNVLRGQGCVTCGTENQGKRMFNRINDTKYTVDLNATAQWSLTGRIGAKTSLGAQYNHDKLFAVNAQADILPPGIISLSAGAQKTLTEGTTDVITLGTYVEQQLSLDDRLFLTGALRIDDNSAFGAESRSAYYPKVSGSWVAMETKDQGLINSFRLRAAYGATGQSPRPLDALTYASPVTASIFGAASTPGVTLGGLGDPNLKPERSREIETGFDAGFLNNRVNLEFTLYDKRTKDALVLRTQPYSLGGVASRLENVGVVSNKGIEVSINARVIESRNVTWDLQVEASGNKNRLVELAPGVPPIVGFGFKNIPGYPMFGLWWQGLTGFEDKNGDGAIDPSEVTVTDTLMYHGSTVPTRTLAVNTSLGLFKNKLRIGGQIDYRGGYVTHNVNNLFQCAFQVNCKALHDPSVSLEEQAKAVAGPRAFGAYAENAEHIRLREASLTYTASNSLARVFGARSMNITLTGRNLLLKKFGFQSWDPENVTQSADAANYNFVQQAQPVIGILRINLGF